MSEDCVPRSWQSWDKDRESKWKRESRFSEIIVKYNEIVQNWSKLYKIITAWRRAALQTHQSIWTEPYKCTSSIKMYADYKIIFVINKDPGGQIRSVSWSSRSARPFASCSLARWADSGWQKCGNSVEMCMSDAHQLGRCLLQLELSWRASICSRCSDMMRSKPQVVQSQIHFSQILSCILCLTGKVHQVSGIETQTLQTLYFARFPALALFLRVSPGLVHLTSATEGIVINAMLIYSCIWDRGTQSASKSPYVSMFPCS